MTTTQTHTIEALCTAHREAKQAEDAARARRVQIEESLLALLPTPEEGSKTHKEGRFKVVTTSKYTYKLDLEAFALVRDQVPPELHPVKLTQDETGLKWLRANRPDLWAVLAPCVTVKPAKTGVRVEEIGH